MVKSNPSLTNVPLTAESREKLLDSLFGDLLPHPGEIFIPDDDFYLADCSAKQRAKHMTRLLCRWLGIKPGYIGLKFESGHSDKVSAKRYTIYIEPSLQEDEFVLGAFLAYSLTQYLIEERKQIQLTNANEQAALLANGSVLFGLSLVILNERMPRHIWHGPVKGPPTILPSSFPYQAYLKLVRNYLLKYRIEPASYDYCLTPGASKDLEVSASKRPTHAVRDLRHQIRVTGLKLVGVSWIIILIFSISGFTFIQRAGSASKNTNEAHQTADFYNNLMRSCNSELVYTRQYSDQADIQTLRALNAEELECQSLKNQYEAAQQKTK
ncbi:MAG: hypothetical protein V4702_04595 [Patescibacteria group bacterium]